jgi:uncharacterized damage-inducible protein DinB
MNETKNVDCFKPFQGTIDDLLKHTSDIDENKLEKVLTGEEDIQMTREEALSFIKTQQKCSDEEAIKFLEEAQSEEITNQIESLVKDGLMEIVGYDNDNQPMYQITEKGLNQLLKNE